MSFSLRPSFWLWTTSWSECDSQCVCVCMFPGAANLLVGGGDRCVCVCVHVLTTVNFIAQVSTVIIAIAHQRQRQTATSVTTKLFLWTHCRKKMCLNTMRKLWHTTGRTGRNSSLLLFEVLLIIRKLQESRLRLHFTSWLMTSLPVLTFTSCLSSFLLSVSCF